MAEAKPDAITQSLIDQCVVGDDLARLSTAEQFQRLVHFAVSSNEHSNTFNGEDVSMKRETAGKAGAPGA